MFDGTKANILASLRKKPNDLSFLPSDVAQLLRKIAFCQWLKR